MAGFADWAPNAHAVVVHLPIGLLVAAAGVDLLAILRRDPATVVTVSTGLYVAGTGVLVVAYVTGRNAASSVDTPALAQAIVAQHWDQALWCVWYFGLVATGRAVLWATAEAPRRGVTTALAAAGLAGLLLLTSTAELGAQLVYQHGTGVAAPVARDP